MSQRRRRANGSQSPAGDERADPATTVAESADVQTLYQRSLERIDELLVENEQLKAAAAVCQCQCKADDSDVKPHLRCPSCWGTLRGRGVRKWQRQVSGSLVKRAYDCDKCPADWTVEVRVDEDDGIQKTTTVISEVRQPAVEVGPPT